jgi:DNA mismatch repair protein MutS
MMAQYLDIKAQYPNALLFYRMGDFYELFFEDAVAASEALDIALTKRGKHEGADIPMCGVPVHAAEGYLLTLIRKGFRVAVGEQLEKPAEAKKRGAKSVVKRDVVRLVTPGTLTEESLLEARRHNYLASFAEIRDKAALAWVDISTGAFHVMALPAVRFGPELARLSPSEVLVSEAHETRWDDTIIEAGAAVTPMARSAFDSTAAEKRLTTLFNIQTLDAFGDFSRAEVSAMGGLIQYLEITQKGHLPLLRSPVSEAISSVMQIDAATRRNLELTQTLSGERGGTVLSCLSTTVTAAGGRLMERRVSAPSLDLNEITARQDAVAFGIDQSRLAADLRDTLRRVPDLDRALSRLALNRGGPRDLAGIRNGLVQGMAFAKFCSECDLPDRLSAAVTDLLGHDELVHLLETALVEEPALLLRDGNFIAPGYDTDLDETRSLRSEGRGVIARLQQEYSAQTGIQSLKIKHNNVLGYFIETPATHAEKMLSAPLSDQFIHRQTTANQVRFTTVNLSEMETKILNAANHAQDIEGRHFVSLKEAVLERATQINFVAQAFANFDVSLALADLAVRENWCRPKVDNSYAFSIKSGRHPVVEQALRAQSGAPFIANDSVLDDSTICLLTGPNMAGKSTFLRQNALIALLAQMGSFVPAKAAHIGLVSQLFSRVGASDDLARGRSTFMVEMVETAAILNQADSRALVILDEIGRGTATYDGLSIAWATLEHLHNINRSRALFATHYHELTALAGKLARVENATVAVKEWQGEVIFLHEVIKGAADRSYGVQVAQLAGLPKSVVDRARVVLEALEKGERENGGAAKALIDDLPLFAMAPSPSSLMAKPSAVEERLRDIQPDELTPRDALKLLYELKDCADK